MRKVAKQFSEKSMLWVMLLSLTIIFAAIISSYQRYNKTLKDYDLLNHSGEVTSAIASLKGIVYETESAIRAYLILGDLDNKPDLNINFKNAERQWQKVKTLTADNNYQQQRCDSLLKLIEARYVVFSISITGKNADNDSLVMSGTRKGNEIMLAFTSVIDDMMFHEYELGRQREMKTVLGTRYAPLFFLLASGISFFFIILAYVMLVRAYRQSVWLQKKLARNVRDLNQSNQELEQFAFIASHDLQEPLRKLRSFSSILVEKEGQQLSDEGRTILSRIDVSAKRMQSLIDDLLAFSRLLTRPTQKELVDLNVIVQEIVDELMLDKSRKITFEIPPLPVTYGYASSLGRLFQNVFSNSIKYSKPEEDVRIKIVTGLVKGSLIPSSLDTEKEKLFHQLSITDNGIGFENEYAEKIFTIFKRLHGKSDYSGTGIGLAICKRVAENHDGYIMADSELGVGTTIHLYLPYYKI